MTAAGDPSSVGFTRLAPLRRGGRLIALAGPILGFLAIWELISRSGIFNAALFPPPSAVFVATIQMAASGELARDIVASLVRVVLGSAIGITGGIIVGLITGRGRRAALILEPIIQLLRPLPPVAIIPLIIVWFGIGEAAKVFSIAFAVFFPVWLNTHLGVQFIPRRLIWSAVTLTSSKTRLFWEVVLPATVPFIVAGVRTGLALAFIMVFVSELAGASSGLGYQISVSHLAYRIDRMMAALCVLGVLGALADFGFSKAIARFLPWLGLKEQHHQRGMPVDLPAHGNELSLGTEGGVEMRGVSVTLGNTPVLDNIDVNVRKGEFVAVVGLSGSGKTTLLNALAGFVPSSGSIVRPDKIGVVFQDHAAFPWLSAHDNIAFGLKDNYTVLPWGALLKRFDRRRARRAKEAEEVAGLQLGLAGLSAESDKYPNHLSGGQVQRIGLARALAPDPDVILMDEPYGALDRHTREKMQEWLLDVWSQDHKTVIFVTHDIEEAIFLADRVLVLGNKRIIHDFAVPFARPRSEEIKFGGDFARLRKAILDEIRHDVQGLGLASKPGLATIR